MIKKKCMRDISLSVSIGMGDLDTHSRPCTKSGLKSKQQGKSTDNHSLQSKTMSINDKQPCRSVIILLP